MIFDYFGDAIKSKENDRLVCLFTTPLFGCSLDWKSVIYSPIIVNYNPNKLPKFTL
jgi:hypothetical protein